MDNPGFIMKRNLEMELEKRYPEYFSKYSLVTFNEQISYDAAKSRGEKQDEFLLEYVQGISQVSEVDIEALYQTLQNL